MTNRKPKLARELAARAICATALAVAVVPPVGAQPDHLTALNQAMNNLSHEYIQCAAYYAIVGVAMENSNQPETAREYQEVSDTALAYGFSFGEAAGLLPETAGARFDMELSSMADRIANNTSNISILGRDYATPCLAAMEDMESRVNFWLDAEGVDR